MDTVDLGYGCGFPTPSKVKEIKLSARGKLACRLVNAKISESKQVHEGEDHQGADGGVSALLRVWTHRHLYNLYYKKSHPTADRQGCIGWLHPQAAMVKFSHELVSMLCSPVNALQVLIHMPTELVLHPACY